jgi:hypothetical protein
MANVSALFWEWEYLGDGYSNQPFLIDGIDVFRHPWNRIPDEPKVGVVVSNQNTYFSVYSIALGDRTLIFAAGEIVPYAYGFCRRKAEFRRSDELR